jgi:hypothetical protein
MPCSVFTSTIAAKDNYSISLTGSSNGYSIPMSRSVLLGTPNKGLSSSIFGLVRREKITHHAMMVDQESEQGGD